MALEQSAGCRAGPGVQGHFLLPRLLPSRSVLRLARWHVCLPWAALVTPALVPVLYFAISGLREGCHRHDCIVIAAWPPLISTHRQDTFQFPSLLIVCLLISF